MNHKKIDTYLNLCTQVYDLSKPKPPELDYQFYHSYVTKAQGLILEPMCGTGRFLLPILEEGFDIHGFDASDDMLQALYKKAKIKNLKPTVWKGFLADLARRERYKLIFIPSGSFCLITNQEEAKIALKNFYDHLETDGIFLFEIDTIKSVPPLGIWKGQKWYRPDGKMILLSTCPSFEDNICNITCKYELINNNSIIHTEIEELKIRIYETEDLIKMLKEIVFKHIRAITEFNKKIFTDDSIIYECIK